MFTVKNLFDILNYKKIRGFAILLLFSNRETDAKQLLKREPLNNTRPLQ